MSKYRNTRPLIGGIRWASKAEAAYYFKYLLPLETSGEISELKLQPRLPIIVNEQKICHYVADFSHITDKKMVITEVKGFKTDLYKLKIKLAKALYPEYDFNIVESKTLRKDIKELEIEE